MKDSEFLVDYVPAPGVWPDVRTYWETLSADPTLGRDIRELGCEFDPDLDYPALVDSFISRRVGPQAWRKHVAERLDANRTKHLK